LVAGLGGLFYPPPVVIVESHFDCSGFDMAFGESRASDSLRLGLGWHLWTPVLFAAALTADIEDTPGT
jgi:hypothetical protein